MLTITRKLFLLSAIAAAPGLASAAERGNECRSPLLRALGPALAIARQYLERPECAALSKKFGTPPLSLDDTVMNWAPGHGELVCHSGRVALATGQIRSGGQVIRARVIVCPGFFQLDRREQVNHILHEALHVAGLGEAPHDRGAPTTDQISAAVERFCGK